MKVPCGAVDVPLAGLGLPVVWLGVPLGVDDGLELGIADPISGGLACTPPTHEPLPQTASYAAVQVVAGLT